MLLVLSVTDTDCIIIQIKLCEVERNDPKSAAASLGVRGVDGQTRAAAAAAVQRAKEERINKRDLVLHAALISAISQSVRHQCLHEIDFRKLETAVGMQKRQHGGRETEAAKGIFFALKMLCLL